MARAILLGQNLANGATGATFTWQGGEGGLYVAGTFGGASVTLQSAPVSPLAGLTLTPANTDVVATSSTPYRSFNLLPAGTVRVAVSGGDGSTSLTAVIARD